MSLAITVNGAHVELNGVVDVTTSPSLHVELTEMIRAAGPGAELRIDLAAVSMVDSSGLSVLLGAHKLADARAVRLVLTAVPQHVGRTLSITGLDEVLHITT